MYSTNVRQLNFDVCIQELASRLQNLWSDKIVYFVEGSPGKVQIYDIQLNKISVRDAQIPAANFPREASWCVLQNGNFFYTGGSAITKVL